jgi:hypothetical protein
VVPQKEGPWITVLLPYIVFLCPLWPASTSQPLLLVSSEDIITKTYVKKMPGQLEGNRRNCDAEGR